MSPEDVEAVGCAIVAILLLVLFFLALSNILGNIDKKIEDKFNQNHEGQKENKYSISNSIVERSQKPTIKKESSSKIDKRLNTILFLSRDLDVASQIQKLYDLCDTIKPTNKYYEKLENYYLPEIERILQLMIQSKKINDRKSMDTCRTTILTFINNLETIFKTNKSRELQFEAERRCKAFDSMMHMDGLIQDMIQEELNKK